MNRSCQTDFVEYTETTPIAAAIVVDDINDSSEEDEDIDCDLAECCCLCVWYLAFGGMSLGLLYYTGAL